MTRLRRLCGDALISSGVLAIVLVVLLSVDVRVREQLRLATTSVTLSNGAAELHRVGAVIFDAARTQSIEHAPLLVFAVAATTLLLFMMRT